MQQMFRPEVYREGDYLLNERKRKDALTDEMLPDVDLRSALPHCALIGDAGLDIELQLPFERPDRVGDDVRLCILAAGDRNQAVNGIDVVIGILGERGHITTTENDAVIDETLHWKMF